MDVEPANTVSLRPAGLVTPYTRLVGSLVLMVAVLLVLLGAMLLVRRLAGALVRPLDGGSLLMTALLLAGTSAGLRLTWQCLPAARQAVGRSWLVWTLPSFALLAFAFALSLPETLAWPLWAFWLILAFEEGASLWVVWRGLDSPAPVRQARTETAAETAAEITAATAAVPERETELASAVSELISDLETHEPRRPEWATVGDREIRVDPPQQPAPHILPPNASQQLTRSFEDDGSDTLYGLLRGHFAPGQRSLRLHVSFCPPFDTVPEVTVDKMEGPEVNVKPAQVLAYGLRLDLRLKSLSIDAQDVILELYVRETK